MDLPSENEIQSFRTGCKCLSGKDFGAERLGNLASASAQPRIHSAIL